MPIPNFFIIGAPKSGTTSLATYLRQHPDVYMPGVWEFDFFADDLTWVAESPVSSLDAYLSHFEEGEGYDRIGEKSVFYLASTTAAERIHEVSPHARILCLLRQPVDLMWSMYRYNLINAEETLRPFREALAAESARKEGHRIPSSVHFVENLLYRDMVRFVPQLKRYFQVFGREQVLVLLFDEFVDDTEATYHRVLDFLNLPRCSPCFFEAKNEARSLGLLSLRQYLYTHPPLWSAVQAVVPGPIRRGIRRGLEWMTGGTSDDVSSLDPDLRHELLEEQTPHIQDLEALLDRDLSSWYDPARVRDATIESGA